jgi:hypothetical protein
MEMDDHELLMFRLDSTRLTRCQQKRNGWEILVYKKKRELTLLSKIFVHLITTDSITSICMLLRDMYERGPFSPYMCWLSISAVAGK